MVALQPVTGGEQLRAAFGCFPSGVTAVCALIDGVPAGMAASSFTSVSVSPPLVSVCVQNTSTTWPKLRRRPRLGVSVLSEGQDDACIRLSGKESDRFVGLSWEVGPDSGVFIRDASAWLDCSLYEEVGAGDHTIALLQVHRLHAAPHTPPLVFHGRRFRKIAVALAAWAGRSRPWHACRRCPGSRGMAAHAVALDAPDPTAAILALALGGGPPLRAVDGILGPHGLDQWTRHNLYSLYNRLLRFIGTWPDGEHHAA